MEVVAVMKSAFQNAKSKFTEAPVLDSKLQLCLAEYALAFTVEAVILHILPNTSEHPIAFASHALSASEHNSQVEKEAPPRF